MGLFSNLFGGPPTVEEGLVREYAGGLQALVGMPAAQAADARGLVEKATAAAVADETDLLPPNFGDVLFAQAPKNEKASKVIDEAMAEGATEADVRRWWSLHDLERRLVMEVDTFLQTATYHGHRRGSLSAEQRRVELKHAVTESGNATDAPNVCYGFQASHRLQEFGPFSALFPGLPRRFLPVPCHTQKA